MLGQRLHEGVTVAFLCRLLPLSCFAPDSVEAILDRRQPKGLRLAELLANGLPVWEEQLAASQPAIGQPEA